MYIYFFKQLKIQSFSTVFNSFIRSINFISTEVFISHADK